MKSGRKLLTATAGLAAISYVVACDPKPADNQVTTAQPSASTKEIDAGGARDAGATVAPAATPTAVVAVAIGDAGAVLDASPVKVKPPPQRVKPPIIHGPTGNLMAPLMLDK
jgi:hypothetical protein